MGNFYNKICTYVPNEDDTNEIKDLVMNSWMKTTLSVLLMTKTKVCD